MNRPSPWSGMSDDERALVERVQSDWTSFEDGMGRDFRLKCERMHALYRGFKKTANEWERANPRDRDEVLRDAKDSWGSNLHIPYAFSIVEAMVPRAIAQRPRMLYLPRDEQWQENAENIQMLMDAQQDAVSIELAFQEVLRAGLIYGLGISKAFWRKEWSTKRSVKPGTFGRGWVVSDREAVLTFDDPDYEDVDPFDFAWDPYGYDIEHCGWTGHRTWLSLKDCMARIVTKSWNTDAAKSLTEEDIRRMGGRQAYDEAWGSRMVASGFQTPQNYARGEQIHEIWEWHDGERVLTVLDRTVLVQDAESPCCGIMPFQVYRPTPLQKQMVGIGEIEPIEDLSRELDMLRSRRADAATLALCAGYFYEDGAVEEDDIVFGPAAAIRVTNANPSEAIVPIPTKEPPGSSYREEQNIIADIERVTGYGEMMAGGNPESFGTATEAQLVQQAVSMRVGLKSRRFEVENIRPAAQVWLRLNQRMIMDTRTARVPDTQAGDDPNVQRWKWVELGPGDLRGEFEVLPEGGSTAAENPQLLMQEGMQMWQTFQGNPHVDQRWLLVQVLRKFGVKHPAMAMAKGPNPIPSAVLDVLGRMGVRPELIQQAVEEAQRQDPMLPPPQIDQAQQQAMEQQNG